jgi:hypothetical protein
MEIAAFIAFVALTVSWMALPDRNALVEASAPAAAELQPAAA